MEKKGEKKNRQNYRDRVWLYDTTIHVPWILTERCNRHPGSPFVLGRLAVSERERGNALSRHCWQRGRQQFTWPTHRHRPIWLAGCWSLGSEFECLWPATNQLISAQTTVSSKWFHRSLDASYFNFILLQRSNSSRVRKRMRLKEIIFKNRASVK